MKKRIIGLLAILLAGCGTAVSMAPPPLYHSQTATPRPIPRPTAPAPSLAPTSAPMPTAAPPTIRSVPVVVRHHTTAPPPPAIRPVTRRNYLNGPFGLATPITWYHDCSGRAAVPSIAAYDTCDPYSTYIIGHNPGVFTPFTHMGVGSVVTWWDGNGIAHQLRIIEVRTVSRYTGGYWPTPAASHDFQFQTCATLDATWDHIYDAVELN